MKNIQTFEEFLNEGKVTVKRKYTESHPEKAVSEYAPIREKVLSFINSNGTVTHKQLLEFFKSLNEESGGATSRKWLNKNTVYFNIKEKNGDKTYSLSNFGKRVHESILKQKTT